MHIYTKYMTNKGVKCIQIYFNTKDIAELDIDGAVQTDIWNKEKKNQSKQFVAICLHIRNLSKVSNQPEEEMYQQQKHNQSTYKAISKILLRWYRFSEYDYVYIYRAAVAITIFIQGREPESKLTSKSSKRLGRGCLWE